jgi:arginase
LTHQPLQLLALQGRIDDRSPNATLGSLLAAQAIARRLGTEPRLIGSPAPHKVEDWRTSLTAAEAALGALAAEVKAVVERREIPLLVTSSCAASLVTLPIAVSRNTGLKVLWVDAHGDFNTPETTVSSYLAGMALAGACGIWNSGHGAGVDPRSVVVAGVRDIDVPERELLRQAGVSLLGPDRANPGAIKSFIGDSPVWIHIDWDVLEPGYIPTFYPVEGGLLPTQLRDILQSIPPSQIVGLELVEFEAPEDQASRDAALSVLLEIIAPLLDRTTSA